MDRTEIVFAADLSDSTVSGGELADFIADALKILPSYHAGIISFGGMP